MDVYYLHLTASEYAAATRTRYRLALVWGNPDAAFLRALEPIIGAAAVGQLLGCRMIIPVVYPDGTPIPGAAAPARVQPYDPA